MIPIAISTSIDGGGEYAAAVESVGAQPKLLEFDANAVDAQLDGVAGVLLSGGGDVAPRWYGRCTELAAEVDERRDAFELTLVRRARERGLPTLCICRGAQIANVAFGGTLIPDIGTAFDPAIAALHRMQRNGETDRGLIPGHAVVIQSGSLLAAIAETSSLVTGSRHHQSIEQPADDLAVVGATAEGIVEAVEARFPSPFWLGVQWHPESTLSLDDGASRRIFEAFATAARIFRDAFSGRR